MSSKLRDVSSSSSEAESDAESESPSKCQPVQQKQRRQRQGVKYQCPADFVYCDYSPCTSTRQNNLNDGNTELWLIKAPVNFNPDSLSGSRVPLMGLEALQLRAGTQQIYSVLSRPAAPTDLRLLTSDGGWPDDALRGPAFSGLINICESYGDCRGNQAPVAIPACPAPRVPEGLRQRFQPFGSRTLAAAGTKSAPEDPAGAGPPMPAKRVKPDPEEGEGEGEQKRKKKKKKKDKSVKEEREEEEVTETAMSSQSLAETPQEFTPEGGEAEEEKKKKKKKKKSKDRDGEAAEQCDTGAETSLTVKEEEEVEVKIEPVDPAYGDVEDSGKKKKKKKKREKVPSSD